MSTNSTKSCITPRTRLLFPKLPGLDPHVDRVLDRLDHDHVCGEHTMRELEHAPIGCEMMAETGQREVRREAFESAVQKDVAFYLEHMQLEVSVVLPLVESSLDGIGDLDPGVKEQDNSAHQPLVRTVRH